MKAFFLSLAAVALLAVASECADPPTLEIPAETKATSDYVLIQPKTTAVSVSYVGLSGADPLPSAVLKDPRSFLFPARGLAAGRYRFAAIGASKEGEQVRTDFAVLVGIQPPTPPPDPPPTPPDPPPAPDDAFSKALKAAWGDETPESRLKIGDLAGLYRIAAQEVKTTDKAKVFEYFQVLTQARKSLLDDMLPKVRGTITKELDGVLPTSVDAPLDATARELCSKTFARVADYLGRLK